MEGAVAMETRLCDNCKKDVPVNNYLNHSIHCPRNIRLCPRCNEPYPIIEMEAHIDQDHAEVVCPDCYEFMEAADLPSHKTDSCPKRLVSCIICEVDLPASELNEHLDYCGSRSDRCDGCGKLVLMKHQPFHLSTRHALVKPETEAQQAQCIEQFLNQYKTVTSAGVEQDNTRSTNSNSNKATATTSSRSTMNSLTASSSSSSSLRSSNGISSGIQSSSISNGINTGSQLHQTANNASSNSSYSCSTANLISSTSSASNAVSTSLVSPLKSSPSPSYLPTQPSASSPSPSYLSSLPAPSSSVVALLEPVFNAPTSSSTSTSLNNPIRPNTAAPSSSSSAPSKVSPAPSNSRAEDYRSDFSPSVATLRNVDNAIRECVDSISAGLRVGAGGSSDVSTIGSISSSLNALRSQSSPNNKVDSARSSRDGTGLSINRILSNINNSNEMSPSALSQSSSNRASSSFASSTSQQTTNSSVTASGHAARLYTANEPHYEEEGAASLESQFSSRPQTGAKFELLRPTNGSEPSDRMKPVNRPPLQTRRRNYQDDVLTEYMHLLEEQGLSNGLHTNSSSHNKPTRSTTSTSRPSSNLLGTTNPYNAPGGFVDQDNLFNAVGARGLRDNNGRQHIAPRETVRERADRMRRDREREELTALTRATELRGLNQVLCQGRNIVNQALDEEAALCLPCEFCDAPIPMDHLILHQTGCRPDLIYH